MIAFSISSCQDEMESAYLAPDYTKVALQTGADSLKIPLSDSSYASISSLHCFTAGGAEYLSFFDKHAQVVQIYQLPTMAFYKSIALKKAFGGKRLSRAQAYAFNFDSILVYTNYMEIFMLDSACRVMDSLQFSNKDYVVLSELSNRTPPVFKGSKLYLAARPYLNTSVKKNIRKWKVMLEADFATHKTRLYGKLPGTYQDNAFDIFFFDHGYCVNPNGEIVLSFPPDSNIYLADHRSIFQRINAKSQLHSGSVTMTAEEATSSSQRNFLFKDTYSSIYYDPVHLRYIRIAQSKIPLADYRARDWQKPQTAVILDQHFQTIGESQLDKRVDAGSVFTTSSGKMYARLLNKSKDTITLVSLRYSNLDNTGVSLHK